MNIAVLLPCYNEEAAIAGVVADFKAALPQATVYVFDNNSTDHTADVATKAGAVVRHVAQKGKGNVVRRMFADVEADIYIMADGDGTYDSSVSQDMIDLLVNNNLDMVVGARDPDDHGTVSRKGHRFGNDMLNRLVRFIFSGGVQDMLSGYRVFSRRFVKSFPAFSQGFEIETELTIHALQLRLPVTEMNTRYFERAEGTESKLSTYKDGLRILNVIIFLFKEGRPFLFFSLLAVFFAFVSLFLGLPVVFEYFETGLVPRFPTLFVSVGVMLTGMISFVCGIILDSVSRGRLELKRLTYLNIRNS